MVGRTGRVARVIWCAGVMTLAAGPVAAQPALDVFRVFLNDGRVLNSHGECASLPDDLVCVVKLGGGGIAESYDVVSLPRVRVDEARTAAYTRALRAATFGAGRGEQEYVEFTASLERVLEDIRTTSDASRRLQIALDARTRVASWSAERFGYRSAETRQLLAMLDDVIAELRIAAGQTSFSFAISASADPATGVPILPGPAVSEAISAALTAAEVTTVASERLAILRSAVRVAQATPGLSPHLVLGVTSALRDEEWFDRRYRALMEDMLARAAVAVRQGRPEDVSSLMVQVDQRDALMGHRRPSEIASFLQRLEAERTAAEAQRMANAQWAMLEPQLREYQRRIRPAFDIWVSHRAVFRSVKLRGVEIPWPPALDDAVRRLKSLDVMLTSLQPVPELQPVHGILRSAVQLAHLGLVMGQRLAVARNDDVARRASSAIAGAELLFSQARAGLQVALQPPRVR